MASTPSRSTRSARKTGDDRSTLNSAADAATSGDAVLRHSEDFTNPESRDARIAAAAYYRAERRGFAPGHELADWLEAEREIDAAAGEGPTPSTATH